MPPARRLPPLLLVLAAAPTLARALAAPGVAAQEPAAWNAPEVLALVGRARAARQADAVDSERRAYQALATGHVFFLVDRPSTGERTLVKADQIAIEVYWKAPRSTRQRIVGMRDQKVLPTRIRYHLDHLTVVQDDFADVIRIGDGDEVASVAHPVAPGAEQVYDFALGDAIAIGFPDGGQVDVQEIRVRPRALERPGFVGSLYVDRASAAIVRMKFTFTPASYVDSYLDYIQIALDNSLWEGRWWLPYKQELEVRREMPQLDFEVGSVIRGRFDVGDYVLNPELTDALFDGARVTAVSEAERAAYPFQEPLIPPAEKEGLAPTPTLEEVRAEAIRLTTGRYLSGLTRLRPYLPSASELARWNRAEGAFMGAGMAWRPNGAFTIRGNAGWSFGRGEPALALTVESGTGRFGVRGTLDELRDLGPFPGELGAVNTLSAMLVDDDWLDPWFSSGVEIYMAAAAGRPLRLGLVLERQEDATVVLDSARAAEFRPVPRVTEGWLLAVDARRDFALPRGIDLALTARAARFDREESNPNAPTDWYGRALASVEWERVLSDGAWRLLARLHGGLAFPRDDVPAQENFVIGGRGTVPGHPYRGQGGDRFWLVRAEAARSLIAPWLTGRVFGAAGHAYGFAAPSSLPVRLADPTPSPIASAGGGLGFLWDILHVDLARGLDGGEWELVVSVDRRFRGWL